MTKLEQHRQALQAEVDALIGLALGCTVPAVQEAARRVQFRMGVVTALAEAEKEAPAREPAAEK